MVNELQTPTASQLLAVQAGELIRSSIHAENEGRTNEAEAFLERLDNLDMASSFLPADNAEAALHQLGILHGALDLLASHAGKGGEEFARLAERAVVNLTDFVERRFSIKREEHGFDYYMPRNLDRRPFVEGLPKSEAAVG
jgi:hypothetical protein